MAYAALYSGGKDSTLALWLAQERGIEIDWLITVLPERNDSYMFHRPNLDMVPLLAEAMDIPLIQKGSSGVKEEELADLERALGSVDAEGVITGAVASRYQRDRIVEIATGKDLKVISPLWGMEPEEILEMLLEEGFECVIVGVAAMGLDDRWLGRELDRECVDELKAFNERYGINVAGEGGEYESLVLKAPNFRWGFEIVKACKNWDGHRGTYDIKSLRKRFYSAKRNF